MALVLGLSQSGVCRRMEPLALFEGFTEVVRVLAAFVARPDMVKGLTIPA
jgi:hypothetical protein